jgi:hypothetical protein
MMLMAIIEIPLIENNSGSEFLFLPTENQKIELSISNLNTVLAEKWLINLLT